MRQRLRSYSVALVGLGYRGYRSHFFSLVDSTSFSITAVCDTDRVLLESFSSKHRHIPAYDCLPQLLHNHKPDFAIVSVPHGAHTECILTLAAKGVSVLKEKPVAGSVNEYDQLANLPIKIGVTFQKRFEPHFIHFRSLLPLVGDVAAVDATLALNITNLEETWRATAGVGVTDYGGDDISDIILDWKPRNCIGDVRLSRVAHQFAQRVTVTGTNGTPTIDQHEITHYDPEGCQTLNVNHQTEEKQFPTSLAEVRETVSVADAIKSSLTSRHPQHPIVLSSRDHRARSSTSPCYKSLQRQGSIAAFSTSTGLATSCTTRRVFRLNTGASIPVIGLGTRRAHRPGEIYAAVRVALQAGYRMIDTAQSSGNEHELGQAIKDSGVPRNKIWVTTKLDNRWHTRVEEAVKSSLKALDLDYMDLYLMHWPVSVIPERPSAQLSDWTFIDTWQEMQRIPVSNVRNIGVSNFGITHLEILLRHPSCKMIPAVNQVELHPYWPSHNLLAYCKTHGIHCTAYACLGSCGSPLFQDQTLCEIARRKGKTPQQVLYYILTFSIMWGIQRGTSVIPKSVTSARIQSNVELDGWWLTTDEMDRLDGCKTRFKSCKDDWLPVRVFDGDED
ncbi:NADP-dependent oxidoreductase domain-containing protein [Aspergillus karnatakaensis]|uniref:NADP-dependent oxidoreductase domain-containing protein n=1 Tax=Aspergillus karnatakaensis TaxID=1810916 RepID=UPI003CCDF12B